MTPISFTVEIFTFVGIGLWFVGFRVFCRTRRKGIQGLKADDYLMLCATIPAIAYTVLAYRAIVAYRGLANNGMSDEERSSLSPDSEEYKIRVVGSKVQFTAWFMWLTAMWTIKASMCAFYRRLTVGVYYNLRIWFGFTLIATTYIGSVCCVLFSCWPLHLQWQINPNPGNTCQPADSRVNYYVCVSLDVITELYLLAIIIPLLWETHLPKSKKISLSLMFSGGVVVVTASILTAVDCFTAETHGGSPSTQGISWSGREIFVALVTTNIPMTWRYVRDKLRPYIISVVSGASEYQENIDTFEGSARVRGERENGRVVQPVNPTMAIEGQLAKRKMPDQENSTLDEMVRATSSHMAGITKEEESRNSAAESHPQA
ncbi:hypothetical protein BGZ63DRAFT_497356 [Mariannaea sp. PMI_226]|nr:hypothetical protein BGZ63DRAFT_497356 [Mariannaea sp. PMI_226]